MARYSVDIIGKKMRHLGTVVAADERNAPAAGKKANPAIRQGDPRDLATNLARNLYRLYELILPSMEQRCLNASELKAQRNTYAFVRRSFRENFSSETSL
jgi:hypothetical protein